MARTFLKIYVGLSIFIIVINILMNIFKDETFHLLSSDDWLIFIIACGALAISESIDRNKDVENSKIDNK